MADVEIVAVLVAAVAAFVLSGAYYGVLGDHLAAASDAPEAPMPVVAAVELARSLVVAVLAAWLVVRTGTDDLFDGLGLGLVLWLGFPVVLWIGAMVHERTPWRLAAIHAGDWLLKLLLVTGVAAAWP